MARSSHRPQKVLEKNPQRQLRGARNRAQGKAFEQRLMESFTAYRKAGVAVIGKTPEPMRVLQNLGSGKFMACFEEKAQPDFKGVVAGGRTILFEAKHTETDRFSQDVVKAVQAQYMNDASELGAWCYVICGFATGGVYCIPWHTWVNMKAHWGRKYVTEADLQIYRVPTNKAGVLLILNHLKGDNTT